MNERAAIGAGSSGVNVDLAVQLAKEVMIDGKPAIEDSAVKARLANFYVEEAGLKYTSYRTLSALSRRYPELPENSIVSSWVRLRCSSSRRSAWTCLRHRVRSGIPSVLSLPITSSALIWAHPVCVLPVVPMRSYQYHRRARSRLAARAAYGQGHSLH